MSQVAYAEPRDFRKEAEAHWSFIEKLAMAKNNDNAKDILWTNSEVKYLYIEAMVHGFKHAQQEIPHSPVSNDLSPYGEIKE